ncbi:MAG TPA: DUF1223 domain-containing protein [Chitinophagaceae bacterium]
MRMINFGVAFFMFASFATANCQNQDTTTKGFAVVELFTSEGCSSCPPADIAVAKLLNDHNDNVYVLGFHVDYWNYLGWKDIFSDAAYSTRQEQYGHAFQLNSVYTPQIVVNGSTQFVGSNEAALRRTVSNDLKQPVKTFIKLTAKSNDNHINITYNTNALSPDQLNIAIVQLHAESKVQRGENAGKILEHVNVVRDFKTINFKSTTGNVDFVKPQASSKDNFIAVAFIQNIKSMKISAAAKTVIE